ncbi:LAFA_0E00672g1_1 [Lachancea sp. 'fantastica']|nr:LAFA_0E00672g1_1 [Lachancea sp. 'fantastica']
MGGILKNPLPDQNGNLEDSESISDFRKQVYKNTQLNAQLSSTSNSDRADLRSSPKKHSIPKDVLSMKHDRDTHEHQHEDEERLKWNQQNLDANDVAKLQYQDISIDEPKTPYQGAVDPSGEYYRDDDEDELESLSLGEPIVAPQEDKVDEESDEDESQELSDDHGLDPNSKEARHKRFEALRKQHYNVKDALETRKTGNMDFDEDEDAENDE